MSMFVMNVWEVNTIIRTIWRGNKYAIPRDGKVYELPDELAEALEKSSMVKIFNNFKLQQNPPKVVETNVKIVSESINNLINFPEVELVDVTREELKEEIEKEIPLSKPLITKPTRMTSQELTNILTKPSEPVEKFFEERQSSEQLEKLEKDRTMKESLVVEESRYSNGQIKPDMTGALKGKRIKPNKRKAIQKSLPDYNPAIAKAKSKAEHLQGMLENLDNFEKDLET